MLEELAKDQGEDGAADQQRLDQRERSLPQSQGVQSEAADISNGTGDPQRVAERPEMKPTSRSSPLPWASLTSPSTSVLERSGNPEQGGGR